MLKSYRTEGREPLTKGEFEAWWKFMSSKTYRDVILVPESVKDRLESHGKGQGYGITSFEIVA